MTPSRDRLWIKDPLAIAAEGAARGLVVEGRTIAELVPAGAEPSAPCRVFDASRHVVLPGLVNTHHHFYQTLTRAHPAAINKPLFPWLQALYPLWARLTPDDLRAAVRIALVELLMSGCTTAADHHYLYPAGLESAVDIEVAAAREIGLRMTVTRGSMNLSEKDGGLPPDARRAGRGHDPARQRARAVAVPRPQARGRDPDRPRALLALHRHGAADARDGGDWRERFDCPLHTHLAETADETAFCEARYGCRPVDLLARNGWLVPRAWVAHGIHFDDAEVARLGRHGVGVCHCAASNMVLASGICRTVELEAAGAKVGLGVDGSASNDASNMMEALRQALMIGRLRYGADKVTHHDVIRWGTEGSARCLGRDDIGRIAPGLEADLALFTLDETRFAGAHDPLAALILCNAHRADRVMVGGRWRVEDGQPVGIDLAKLIADQRQAARRFA